MKKVKLYTTGCPKCRVLETKLGMKNVEVEKVSDPEIIRQKGILSVPVLEVEGKLFSFLEANKYVNALENKN